MSLTLSCYDDDGNLDGIVPSQRTERHQAFDPGPIVTDTRRWSRALWIVVGLVAIAAIVLSPVMGWHVR